MGAAYPEEAEDKANSENNHQQCLEETFQKLCGILESIHKDRAFKCQGTKILMRLQIIMQRHPGMRTAEMYKIAKDLNPLKDLNNFTNVELKITLKGSKELT